MKKILKNLFKLTFKGSVGTGTLYLIGLLVLVGFMGTQMTNGLVPTQIPTITGTPAPVTPILQNTDTDPGKKNLQLYTFGFTTPAPTTPPLPTQPPTNQTCQTQIKPPTCTTCTHGESMLCKESEPTCTGSGGIYNLMGWYEPPYTCAYIETVNKAGFDQKKNDPNCVEACIAKPVIYLYPLIPTFVDVAVKVPGKIFISDPLYPEGGWKNVLANPDGSLLYKNKQYKELFFESDVDKVNPPNNGMVIAKKDLKSKLTEFTTRLGLKGIEQEEFLEYWLPELYKLDAPLVLFSIIDPVEKERIDHVEITPKPDTFIAFLAYFKPLKTYPTNLKPLVLPEKPPLRIGYTAVEWGGTIDY
ncbi:MAG TPA: hypothetical protein VM077_05155 [Candidatus Limnocylindrales bacterium]|nr:hypothetical protein [Candidatus Limnocylindrales bacterium]